VRSDALARAAVVEQIIRIILRIDHLQWDAPAMQFSRRSRMGRGARRERYGFLLTLPLGRTVWKGLGGGFWPMAEATVADWRVWLLGCCGNGERLAPGSTGG
jgi:hypothetical protein